MDHSTGSLTKTQTAADWVGGHARNPVTRAHAAEVRQAIAFCRTADDAVDVAASLARLLTAVRECAGSTWLKANSDDPDVARFTALLEDAAGPGAADATQQAGDLDELLSTVLWAAHGP